MSQTQVVLYNPKVAERLNANTIWTQADLPGWGKLAWNIVTDVIGQAGGKSAWKQYIDEFTGKTWATDYGARQAALAVKRFYDTASGTSMNPEWTGNTDVATLNKAAYHETGSMVKNIANRFFAKLHDFDSGNVLSVGGGGAPSLTPGDGKGLLVKVGQTALSLLTGDELEARGKLIELGKTELGPLLHDAFKKLPHDDWMRAIEKEWDVEDANFRDGEQVVTHSGKLAIVKKAYVFRKDVVSITLAETGKTVDVRAAMLNRAFKRGEWAWTARFEPIAGKVVKSIGLIIRVQKVNVFYQMRKLSDGTEDLFLAKHMLPMDLKYQAVLNSTPMVIDFKQAALMNSRVKRSPCGLQNKMETNLAMHEGREQYDNMLTRQLITEGDANNLEVQRAIVATKAADAFGLNFDEALPWESTNARQLVGVARTGQSWLEWLKGGDDFPLAVKEKRRRILEETGVKTRRRLPEGDRYALADSPASVYTAGSTPMSSARKLSPVRHRSRRSPTQHRSRSYSRSPRRTPRRTPTHSPGGSGYSRFPTPRGSTLGPSERSRGLVQTSPRSRSGIRTTLSFEDMQSQLQALPIANNDPVLDCTARDVGPVKGITGTSYMGIFIFALLIVLLLYYM